LEAAVPAIDPEGAELDFVTLREPGHGALTLESDGRFTYAPDPDFFGTDRFDVIVGDGRQYSPPSPVTIAVRRLPDDAPRSSGVFARVTTGEPYTSRLLALDPDEDPLTFGVDALPAHGAFELDATGAFTYLSEHDYEGDDTVVAWVDDGTFRTPVLLRFRVRRPDAPRVVPLVLSAVEDTPLGAGVVTSPAGLPVRLADPPANGVVDLDPSGTFTYTPDPDVHGL
ncbi:MAG: Ig-like domain-containing protein, partial [Myxococcota bacterium]